MRAFASLASAVTLATATLCTSSLDAQERPTAGQVLGRPASSVQQPGAPTGPLRAPTEQELRQATGVETLQFQPAPTISWGAIAAINASRMQGWIPVTVGAAFGGPSVVKLGTGHRLVIRAPDSQIYDAPIDVIGQSGPLPTSAWRLLVTSATSEPYCVADYVSPTAAYFCGYLAAGGSAAVARITDQNVGQTWALGGQNGGGRVTLGPAPDISAGPDQLSVGMRLLVWDGAATLFRREFATVAYKSPNGLYGAPFEVLLANERGWRAVGGAYLTPIGCVRAGKPEFPMCAQGTISGVRMFFDPWRSAALGGMPGTQVVTPPLPSPIGRTAPELVTTASGKIIVVVRAADGTIYQSRQLGQSQPQQPSAGYFGPWISEGGLAREGSGISCTAVNEQPICFIQATDGRIYRKAFAAASGL